MQAWLVAVAIVAATISVLAPPAFWLCVVGGALAITGNLANSVRTGQWYTWQRWDRSVSWFEGWAYASGAVLCAVPLLAVLVRAHTGE
jgi:hypothetical protein